jgi:hypothetical protein
MPSIISHNNISAFSLQHILFTTASLCCMKKTCLNAAHDLLWVSIPTCSLDKSKPAVKKGEHFTVIAGKSFYVSTSSPPTVADLGELLQEYYIYLLLLLVVIITLHTNGRWCLMYSMVVTPSRSSIMVPAEWSDLGM